MPLSNPELDQLIKDLGLKRPRGGSQRKPIAHGTYRGSRQHRYRKEPLCQPCLDAEAAYQRGRKPTTYISEEQWQARKQDRAAMGGRK